MIFAVSTQAKIVIFFRVGKERWKKGEEQKQEVVTKS